MDHLNVNGKDEYISQEQNGKFYIEFDVAENVTKHSMCNVTKHRSFSGETEKIVYVITVA